MLSTNTIGKASSSSQYFMGEGNYYIDSNTSSQEKSAWWGKGAEHLGFSGAVKGEAFANLLSGVLPGGELLGITIDGERKHRPGFDLTFSAPKSVSILALMSEDPKVRSDITALVMASTRSVLVRIEQDCAEARVTIDGDTQYTKTGNLTAALFLHELSRESDPQLHVHSVIMNATQRSDGAWRALASKAGYYGKGAKGEVKGFIERVRHYKKQYGLLFRSELAFGLKQMGFELDIDKRTGFFEVSGFSQETLKTFSTRSQQISNYLDEKGMQGAKAAAVGTIKTRQDKVNLEPTQLAKTWRDKAQQSQVRVYEEVAQTLQAARGKPIEQSVRQAQRADLAIGYAIETLFETSLEVRENDLLCQALQYHSEHPVSIHALSEALKRTVQHGDLVMRQEQGDEPSYLSAKMVDLEKEIIASTTWQCPSELSSLIQSMGNRQSSQRPSLGTLYSAKQQVCGVMAVNGQLPAEELVYLSKAVRSQHLGLKVLSPRVRRSMEVQGSVTQSPNKLKTVINKLLDDNEYQTLHGFLKENEKSTKLNDQFKQPAMWVVEEAHKLSTSEMHQLLTLAKSQPIKILFTGDTRQLGSWKSGHPFELMCRSGLNTVLLQAAAQDYSPQHLETVSDVRQSGLQKGGESLSEAVNTAFDKISDRVIAIPDEAACFDMMATHYASLSEDKRLCTQLVVPNKTSLVNLTQSCRTSLKRLDLLGAEKPVSCLLPKSMKSQDYALASKYRAGDRVRFYDDFRSLGVKRNQYCTVLKVDKSGQKVLIGTEQGDATWWSPGKVAGCSGKVALFREKLQPIAVGETLVWRQTHKPLGLYSGDTLVVSSVGRYYLRAEVHHQGRARKVTLDLRDPAQCHFDYGYVATPHQLQAQGKPVNVIAYMSSQSRQSDQRQFYTLLSTSDQNLFLYTDNQTQLRNRLVNETKLPESALSVLLRDRTAVDGPNTSYHTATLTEAVARAIERSIETSGMRQKLEVTPHQAIEHAIQQLSDREAAFSQEGLFTAAVTQAMGTMPPNEVEELIDTAEGKGQIIRGLQSKDGVHWTTPASIEVENAICQLAKAGIGQKATLLPESSLPQALDSVGAFASHRPVLQGWLSSRDRVIVIQGLAGTGKTTLLVHGASLLKDAYKTLCCLAPTHTAVAELSSRDLPGQTVDSYIRQYLPSIQQQDKGTNSIEVLDAELRAQHPDVIVVDESAMVSNARMHDLLRITHTYDARLVLMGDSQQYSAIEAGKPHEMLQRAGIATFTLADIKRQKEDFLKAAVTHAYKRQFDTCFASLTGHMTEIQDGRQRIEKLCQDYFSLSKLKREETLILTLTNKERRAINGTLRSLMQAKGELAGRAIESHILVSLGLSQEQLGQSEQYHIGDIVRVNGSVIPGVTPGEYLTVTARFDKENRLLLRNDAGEKKVLSLNANTVSRGNIEAFKSEERQLQVGDRIVWTKTDKRLGKMRAEQFTVTHVDTDKQSISLQPDSQKNSTRASPQDMTLSVKDMNNQHWDHAYAITGYSAQGKTVRSVMLHIDSQNPHLAHQASFIVGLTRVTHDIQIFTDDNKSLAQTLHYQTGEKTSALETIGALPFPSNSEMEEDKQQNTGVVVNEREELRHKVRQLHRQTEPIMQRLLGEPNERTSHHLRYSYSRAFGLSNHASRGGSLYIAISGEKQGLWHCFKTGEGGNLLQLIQMKLGCSWQDALDYAQKEAGLSYKNSIMPAKTHHKDISSPNITSDLTLTEADKKRVERANKLAQESQSVSGTLAETYLREHRKITIQKWPDSIRFHPGIYSHQNQKTLPALLVVAHNANKDVQAVQAIYLDEKTENKANVLLQKQTWGVLKGASVNMDRGGGETTYIAEGPETGLSIYQSIKKGNVQVSLGKSNMAYPNPKVLNNNVVLCLDNDGNNHASQKLTDKAIAAISQTKKLKTVMPEKAGQDFNDVLRERGSQEVRRFLANKKQQEQAHGYNPINLQEKDSLVH